MPQLKGVIKTPTGEPLGGATITLTSLYNRAGVLKGVFSRVTTQSGEYDFPVLPGVYSVRLTRSTQRLAEIGVIRVYEDSTDGSLNDFLGATDINLRPEALKKFEELAQQALQSAEKAGEHADAAEQARQDTETLAGEIRQDAEEIAGNVQKAEVLASETNQNAARAEQAVSEVATLTGEAKASAEAAAQSKQEAKQYRDEAQQIVDGLNATTATTTEKGLVQLCSDTDNDSEELAATPKAVKTVMDETKTKAPLDSPAFTGTPTTPTPDDGATGTEVANVEFVLKRLAALVDSSPEALDTLNELAAALGDDPNFATTMTNALAGKQPLNDVLTAISNLNERADNLLYFNQDGDASLSPLSEKARSLLVQATAEAMRNELELKAAATMEPQSDIRDRTQGRLALSGMYGFGQAFASAGALSFEGQSDFTEWLKEVTPGRYAVSIADSSTLLVGTTIFNGIIDVMWSPFDNDESDATRKFKTLLCHNQYYEGEHSIHCLRYWYSDNSWSATTNVIVYDGDSLAYLMASTSGNGPSSYYQYPAVGVPVLAVYQGTAAGDTSIKIGAGETVAGSRLGPVTITCSINDSGSYVSTPRVSAGGAGAFSFPGRYQALSGLGNSSGSDGRICLFVRVE